MGLDSLQAYSDQLAEMVERVTKSVVRVDARDRISGSGIIWSAEGLVLTANHVVEREEEIHVQFNGSSFNAELVGRDPSTDLAVLKVQASNLPAAQIAPAKSLRPGNLVFAIGRPWSADPIVSGGIVSALGKFGGPRGGGEQFREGLIRADVILYPGFSGGALADASGRVVGMNTSVIGRDLSIAVPVETAARIVPELVQEGHVKRGFLGVGLQKIPLNESLAQKLKLSQETGLVVLTIEPGSGADKSGLLAGDILIGLDGAPIARLRELRAWLAGVSQERTVTARVIRGGAIQELPLQIGVR